MQPTELVIMVETDLAIPTEIDAVGIEAHLPREVRFYTEPLGRPESPVFPLTLGIEDRSGERGMVTVEVSGYRDGRRVVGDRAVVSFLSGVSRAVPLRLDRSCVGVECEGTERCVAGLCVSAASGSVPHDAGE